MKKLVFIHILSLFALAITAQEPIKKSIPKSPEAAFTQQFGDSEIQVAYARPLARGRKIFGALVLFDSLWRTGASDCTTIKFKEDVIVGDKKIGIGKYSLFTIPSANEWTIILNADTTMLGTNGYKAEKDVHRFKVKPEKTDRYYETFTIEINDINAKGEASLNIIWENTLVKVPLKTSFEVITTDKPAPVAVVETPKPKEEVAPAKDAHAGHDMSKMKNTEAVSAPNFKAEFATVLDAYYSLKDALVSDNAKVAATSAKALKTALTKINTKDWTAQQRDGYESLAKKMTSDAQIIADATKIEQQRAQFDTLSDNLFSVTKSLKINTETVYRQFCPMANDGKGAYWLSKENKVKNPYYGKSMLTCGSVKETLK